MKLVFVQLGTICMASCAHNKILVSYSGTEIGTGSSGGKMSHYLTQLYTFVVLLIKALSLRPTGSQILA